jgi:hypothetical protein
MEGVFMPSSDFGTWLLAFVVLLFLWEPVVVIAILGTYAGAYFFYKLVLFWLPQLFDKLSR